jgi:predicted ester cyclase
MAVDRRMLFGLVAALPFGRAFAQSFPPPVPDVPRSEVEQSSLARQNEAIIRRQNALSNRGDFLAVAQTFAEDTRNHGVPVGRKGVLRVLTDIFATFPDYSAEIMELAAIDDIVVVRQMDSGTHKGVAKMLFNGGLLVGVPPTNKRYRVQTIHWYTLKDGLIVEHRASRDDIGMMQQLGLLPMTTRYDLPKVS